MGVPLKIAAWRGLCLRCPNCGRGRLLTGYLRQCECCPTCGEILSDIRADDGPAWLTILLTGHLLAPLILAAEKQQLFSLVTELLLFLALAVILMALLLPRCKGLFIAAIWASRQKS